MKTDPQSNPMSEAPMAAPVAEPKSKDRTAQAEAARAKTKIDPGPSPMSEAPTAAPVVEPKSEDRIAQAEAARAKAAQFMAEKKYSEARKALEDADALDEKETREAKAEAARARAAQYMAERNFTEAKNALSEAEALEAESVKTRTQRAIVDLRTRIQNIPIPFRKGKDKDGIATSEASQIASSEGVVTEPVEESVRIVNLYSKIAAGVGTLPGGLLNFAGILAVQVIMVRKIAKTFGHTDSKNAVRGSILSLIGSAIPATIGYGAGTALAAIPAVMMGTVVYLLVTPALAYAMARAIGNTYIMHFESGGTLLSFDPKAFRSFFMKELQSAGATLTQTPEPAPVTPA
jgi:hypothetical protein